MGRDKKTIYEVVDGQQRLRAILEFLNDQYKLVATTAKSYPVSDLYKKYIGKAYSQLPDGIQNTIWDYQIAVQELRGKEQKGDPELFGVSTYVVESLNDQELRHHSTLASSLAVESLAEDDLG